MSICMDCEKGALACSWMRDGTAVPGWTVRQVLCDGLPTFEVRACPDFEPFHRKAPPRKRRKSVYKKRRAKHAGVAEAAAAAGTRGEESRGSTAAEIEAERGMEEMRTGKAAAGGGAAVKREADKGGAAAGIRGEESGSSAAAEIEAERGVEEMQAGKAAAGGDVGIGAAAGIRGEESGSSAAAGVRGEESGSSAAAGVRGEENGSGAAGVTDAGEDDFAQRLLAAILGDENEAYEMRKGSNVR